MVRAAVQDQWRLLDIRAHDVRLSQLAHRERTLPELGELSALAEQDTGVSERLVMARTRVEDLTRGVAKAEADVEQVRVRAQRDQQRLDSGQGSPKDLQALQHELSTLADRQRVLEDAELELMGELEQAQAELDRITAERDDIRARQVEAAARRDAALAEISAARAEQEAQRAMAAGGLPADLMALYERVRSSGSAGAAKLAQRRCEGCHLELNATDLNRLRDAAEDEVIRCEECGTILVRTAESGI